ncbi:hypothetical protein [Photobacterium leiognathi]|uniref:hypothetical protein n=1 Tax=Photobacterium leiognathi TaxID=553611 RepID=UPI002981D1A4|nr:hypothetical protein [Photobacterium leiognathi]
MNKLELMLEAKKVRSVILEAKSKMSYVDCELSTFPSASCEVSSIILGLLLRTKYDYKMILAVGKREGIAPCQISNHVWLLINDKLILDITPDQFDDCNIPVIVAEEHELHDTFEVYDYRQFDRSSLDRPGCHGYDDIFEVIVNLYENA